MIKNSTIIITGVLIVVAILSYKLIDGLFEQKINNKTQSIRFKEKTMMLEPKILNINGEDLLYIPEFSLKNDQLDIDYAIYRYDSLKLKRL